VAELCLRFLKYADRHYRRPDGTRTSEYTNFALAIRPLDDLYGDTTAASFGPKALRAVREAMVGRGWARTMVNGQVRRIRQIFKWGVSHEFVLASVWHGLQAVEGLKRGRSSARESEPVRPVSRASISLRDGTSASSAVSRSYPFPAVLG
jgi:hypothetical protein